jgi:hypothetical protein
VKLNSEAEKIGGMIMLNQIIIGIMLNNKQMTYCKARGLALRAERKTGEGVGSGKKQDGLKRK